LALYALVAGIIGLWIYRTSRLSGLPDVGDPFDVRVYRDSHVPDSENAFALYRQAIAQLKRPTSQVPTKLPNDWRNADEAVRAWVADNHQAIALWRQATERSQMPYAGFAGAVLLECNFMEQSGGPNPSNALGQFAMLEASRRQQAGDMAGASDWYLALLRFSRHVQTHTLQTGRGLGVGLQRMARRGLEQWAADSRVDTALLHKTLDQVLAIEATTPPISDTLKAHYLQVLEELNEPDRYRRAIGQRHSPNEPDWYVQLDSVVRVRWFLGNETERGRRLARLLFANWLAECDKPWESRPSFTTDWRIYDDPEAPPAARALHAETLSQIVNDSPFGPGQFLFWPFVEHLLSQDRIDRAELIIRLAERLHFRHYGYVPNSPEVLVGRCLSSLPQGFDPILQPRPGPRPQVLLEPKKGIAGRFLLDLGTHDLFPSGPPRTELLP
jgi:hypothetical protein